MRISIVFLLLVMLLVAGAKVFAAGDLDSEFAEAFADDPETDLISDPLEGYNRGVFWVNDKLYFYLFKPVARAYRVVPRPVRNSVGNFFANLSSPVTIVNSLLQMKFQDTARGTARLLLNTTFGLGGLFDPARDYGKLPAKKEDFGQTLGSYRVGQGFYFVLPILGPSSLRDTGGLLVDLLFEPMTYIGNNLTLGEKIGVRGLDNTNALSLDDDSYEKLKRDSLDPYLFLRSTYAQHRLAKVKN
jgi:phospholipid-binding lipoprotein MlaA